MAAASVPCQHEKDNETILQFLINNLEEKIEDLKSSDIFVPQQDFSHERLWTNFESSVKLVSHEATKLCMAFSKPPLPANVECDSLCSNLENSAISLILSVWRFPKSKGLTIHSVLLRFVSRALSCVKEFCVAIKSQNRTHLLPIIGKVWEKCESVSSLPKDNRDAVVNIFTTEHQLVDDAKAELSEVILHSERTDQEQSRMHNLRNGMRTGEIRWRENDRRLVFFCLGLIKAFEVILRKIPNILISREDDNELWVNMLDKIANEAESSSSDIDDLVLSVYPPMSNADIRQHATVIETKCVNILSYIESFEFSTEVDKGWITFAQRAIHHNWSEIQNMTADQTSS